MIISLKNKLNKGDALPIKCVDEKIILTNPASGNQADITNLIDKEELEYLLKVGRAIAVVKDSETLYVSYCFNYHTHSEFSQLDGLSRLSEIAGKSSGISAVTDHGNCFGFLKWQKAMDKVGKKAVFGFEGYMEDYLTGEKNGSHGLFLVKNEIGLKNMFYLCSIAYNEENFYKKPHIPVNILKDYSEGLIFTSACIGGELAKTIVEDYESARKIALFYKEIFGEDYYIEIQRHKFELEDKANPLLIKLANELNIKLVAANDSHFINAEDLEEHKMILAISYKKTIDEISGFEGEGYHYMTDREMVELFSDIPYVIANTIEMAEKCNTRVKTGEYYLPQYPVPQGFSDDNAYLLHLINEGYKERFGGTPLENNPIYLERLEYEKSVVLSMGFSSYFLIVWDYIKWARDNGILVGPGRGSGAGSLCLYCLWITDLDPIKYNLKFERFLNPDRISMPDIDTDFEDSRRQEVVDYVKDKYGTDNVCNIITFGTMQAKSAIKDICRVKGEPVSFANEICNKINPSAKNLLSSIEGDDANAELAELIKANGKARDIFTSALKIEGNTRQTGVHACGVVVADKPLKNYLPTAMVKDSKSADKDAKKLCSQVTMTEVEELGLLKADFLGLKKMSVIGKSLEVINKLRAISGQNPILNYRDIPLNDPYVYADIAKGQCYAVFQIEGEGMRNFMKELFADVSSRIKEIEDKYSFSGYWENIKGNGTDRLGYEQSMEKLGEELFERMIAGVSLYRPGPLDYIPDYIRCMNNPSEMTYDHPKLEPILKTTYSVIVYQEQVMDIVRALAGFSNGQSDTIRKAMGKKKQDILDEYKPYFIYGSGNAIDEHTNKPLNIKGCVANGISEEIASAIWDKMADFAKYAFNKSHAAAYSVVTMACAWLKYYYLAPFMSATLNTYIDNNDKLKGYVNNAKSLGINILLPSVNLSSDSFMTNGRDILFGLKGIKGVGKVTKIIFEERTENGKYKSIQDFVARTYPKGVTKRNFLALAYSGCFDEFGYSRKTLVENCEALMNEGKKLKAKLKKRGDNALTFFDEFAPEDTIKVELENIEEYPKREKLGYELETSGIYISEHPLDSYNQKLADLGVTELTQITDDEGEIVEGKYTFAGIISNKREFFTKKGDKMATFTLSDRTKDIKCTVFPRDYESAKACLDDENALVVIKGDVKDDENWGVQVIVNSIIDIDKIPNNNSISNVCVLLNDMSISYNKLLGVLKGYEGDTPLYIQCNNKVVESCIKVRATSSLFMVLSNLCGYDNVLFRY